MMRHVFALFLALTGLMLVAGPVAVMAMSGAMLCEPQSGRTMEHAMHQSAPAMVDHGHHGADHGVHPVSEASDDDLPDSAPICCDHACVAELTVMPATLGSSQVASGAPHDLSSSDLTELTHPNGLRRPPKA